MAIDPAQITAQPKDFKRNGKLSARDELQNLNLDLGSQSEDMKKIAEAIAKHKNTIEQLRVKEDEFRQSTEKLDKKFDFVNLLIQAIDKFGHMDISPAGQAFYGKLPAFNSGQISDDRMAEIINSLMNYQPSGGPPARKGKRK